jgi:hypothetical protein
MQENRINKDSRVSWIESNYNNNYYISDDDMGHNSDTFSHLTGTIVAKEDDDRYKVKRDDTGKCEILCQRKLRLIE